MHDPTHPPTGHPERHHILRTGILAGTAALVIVTIITLTLTSTPDPLPPTIVFTAALLGYAATRIVELLATRAWRRRRVRIIWINPDSMTLNVRYETPTGGAIHHKNPNGEPGTYLLSGRHRHGGQHSTWIIDETTGWPWRLPTRAETIDKDIHLAAANLSDPAAYHKAMSRNEWREVVRANDPDDKSWLKTLIAAGAIIALAVLGFIAFKVSDLPGTLTGG